MIGESHRGAMDEVMVEPRAEAERNLSKLRELIRIHECIDEPSRSVGADEPDWICRLRKMCLHARAIDGWEIAEIDIAHVIALELRAAYVQMDVVWKCIPPGFRLDAMDGDYWANEARDGILATYDHPTPVKLIIGPAALGDFYSGNPNRIYLQLAVWLGFLILGFGAALTYLAEVLDAGGEVVSRLEVAMMQGLDEPVAMERMSSILGHGERLGDS